MEKNIGKASFQIIIFEREISYFHDISYRVIINVESSLLTNNIIILIISHFSIVNLESTFSYEN